MFSLGPADQTRKGKKNHFLCSKLTREVFELFLYGLLFLDAFHVVYEKTSFVDVQGLENFPMKKKPKLFNEKEIH